MRTILFVVILTLICSTNITAQSGEDITLADVGIKLLFSQTLMNTFKSPTGYLKDFDSTSVINSTISKITNNFDDFRDGIPVSRTQGNIVVHFQYAIPPDTSYWTSLIGKVEDGGIGGYLKSEIEITVNVDIILSGFLAFDLNLTNERLAISLSNWATHEIGHAMGLRHAHAYDLWDPGETNALYPPDYEILSSRNYPREPEAGNTLFETGSHESGHFMVQTLPKIRGDYFVRKATAVQTWSALSRATLKIALEGQGTINRNIYLTTRPSYKQEGDIIIENYSKALYFSPMNDHDINGHYLVGKVIINTADKYIALIG